MDEADTWIRQAWTALAGPGQHDIAEMIVDRHAEAHRRYHTATHVMWVLRHVDDLLDRECRAANHDVDAAAVHAAALFHDIVYDPRSTTNERDSADIAVTALARIGWAHARLALVHRLIVATAGHESVGVESDVLLDADLAVLGGEPDAYRTYVDGVRFEYSFVTDAEWRVGRAHVLETFLERDRVYATATMRTEREEQARANLTAELAALRA